MPRYVLRETPRLHIDETHGSGIEAPNWIVAKEALGFPLSPLQRRMRDGLATQFEVLGHFCDRTHSGTKLHFNQPKLPDATEAFLNTLEAQS